MELGNAFSEINDAEEQAAALRAPAVGARRGDVEAEEGDPDYVEALSYGMPPTGGIGLGIDRLAMLLHRARVDPRRDPLPGAQVDLTQRVMDKPRVVRSMILVRRLLLTLAAVLVVLVGAAAAEAANPVVAAAKRTADARSSVFDMQMTVEASGTSIAIAASGAMRGQDSAKMTMSTSGGGVTPRSTCFGRRGDAPQGKTWRLDLDLSAAKLGLDWSSSRRRGRSRSSTMSTLEPRSPSRPRYGRDRYERAARAAPPSQQLHAIERAGVRSAADERLIGRDAGSGRPLIPLRAAGSPRDRSMTMTFRAYDVSAPPRAQVFDFS